jgi:hypothetical protein
MPAQLVVIELSSVTYKMMPTYWKLQHATLLIHTLSLSSPLIKNGHQLRVSRHQTVNWQQQPAWPGALQQSLLCLLHVVCVALCANVAQKDTIIPKNKAVLPLVEEAD